MGFLWVLSQIYLFQINPILLSSPSVSLAYFLYFISFLSNHSAFFWWYIFLWLFLVLSLLLIHSNNEFFFLLFILILLLSPLFICLSVRTAWRGRQGRWDWEHWSVSRQTHLKKLYTGRSSILSCKISPKLFVEWSEFELETRKKRAQIDLCQQVTKRWGGVKLSNEHFNRLEIAYHWTKTTKTINNCNK